MKSYDVPMTAGMMKDLMRGEQVQLTINGANISLTPTYPVDEDAGLKLDTGGLRRPVTRASLGGADLTAEPKAKAIELNLTERAGANQHGGSTP